MAAAVNSTADPLLPESLSAKLEFADTEVPGVIGNTYFQITIHFSCKWQE